MKRLLSLCLLGATASCYSLADYAPGGGDVNQQASLNLGQRIFHHASANCLDEQSSVALDYSLWREDGAFGYDFGIGHHRDRGTIPTIGNTVVEGAELYGGIRRTIPLEGVPFTPYVGLGLTGWYADRDEEIKTSRDGAELGVGIYERIGAWMPLSESTFVGLDMRFIQEELLHEGDLNMDSHVIALTFGISF